VRLRLVCIWLIVAAALGAVSAQAAPLALHADDAWPRQAADFARVLEDPEGRLGLDDVAPRIDRADGGFVADPARLHPGFSDAAWWFVLDLVNASGDAREFIVDLQSPRLERVDFHLRQGGAWRVMRAGLSVPMDTRETLSRRPSVRIELAPNEEVRLVVRVAGRTAMQFLPRVFTPGALADTELRAALGDVVLIGGLMMVGIFTGLFGVLARRRRHALLGGFFCVHALQEASFRGYGKRYLWPDATEWSVAATPFLFCLGSGLAVLFLRDVIRRERPDIRGTGVLLGYAAMSVVFAGASLFGEVKIASLGYATSMVAICAILLAAGIRHWKQLPLPGRLIVVLLSCILAGAPHRYGEAMGLVALSSTDNPMDSALMLLAMVTILALLAAWVSRLNRAHEAARDALLTWQAAEHDRLRDEVGRQTEALHRALAQAEQTNREQTRIMAYIGHDLRAPIATILSYVRRLRLRAAPAETGLRAIERGADYQLSLIDDLLEYSRDTVQPLSIAPKATDLDALLEDIARYAAALAAQQNNRFDFVHALRLPGPVMLDARRLQQVLLNLLANAAKFTRDGRITLTVAAENRGDASMLTFSVDDTGIGIASEDQTRIFGEFEQGQRLGGGVGLGLFIARRIVRSMGGELHLDSAPNAGSRFAFDIFAPQADVESLAAAVLSTAELAEDELAQPVVDPAAEDTSTDGFAVRPDDVALRELASLAEAGSLSDIQDWCRQRTLLEPACQPFLDAVEDALNALDFGRIQALARIEPALPPTLSPLTPTAA
jgi:signal transduction histidine kinase